jgi:ABC-2 type transport system permease protein
VSSRVSSQPYSFSYSISQAPFRERLAYWLRILRVIARVEFKIKYVDSALGYVWSLAKPLAYFAVLWVVFGRFFDVGIRNYGLYLLIGIVLYTYFIDAVGMMLPTILTSRTLLRRIAFPAVVIPVSASVTATMTFVVNLVAVAFFVLFSDVTPALDWLLLIPLWLELFAFIVGLGLIVSTLYVRFRDVGPLWELCAQLLLFAAPVMYPITILPEWAQKVAMANPLVQVIQDVRDLILGSASSSAAAVFGGSSWRLLPIGIAVGTLLLGVWLCRRDAPSFAERA